VPKLNLWPRFQEEDRGDGGIRRVVEAQTRWLPTMGWELVEDPSQADVVATHAGVALPSVPATTPLVEHCHGLYWYGYTWERWALKMNRDVIRNMRQADVVTAPSKWVAHAIARGTNLDTPVLYHGVEPEDWPLRAPLANDHYVLWNKTRIDPICNTTDLLELAKRVPTQHFITTMFWVDNQPAPKNVEPVGVFSYPKAKALVQHASVYLCTTRETFGIGTLEAMVSGVPVLGWDWGGQAEIVDHMENGWLAKPGDYDSLVAGLEYCLKNRDILGQNGREKVLRDFTWEKAIERYNLLYRSLLERPVSPKVSVVIPAYNMETMLSDSVESALSQQGVDLEVIIVDDASTDTTPDLANAYTSDGRVSVIHNETNQYLAEALNIGIRQARGRYIVPLDADNFLAPRALALLAEALDRQRDIAIAYGSMSVIEEDGREWVSEWPPQNFSFRAQMKHRNQIPSTSMYRRTVWERVGGYRRRCHTAEDADFWCRATSMGANARKVTDAVVLRYRNRSDSMSHVQSDWAWDAWYPWGQLTEHTPWLAPVDSEHDDPVIPMHEFALVSVVIPVGPGHERYVLDALDSIRAQTFWWWEAIVVNDTGHDIPDLPPWVRRVDTPGRVGSGRARNLGMEIAKGEYFIFLDADDYFQPEALELMVTEQHRAGGFVYSDWYKQETGEVYTAPEWNGCNDVLRQLPWPVTCLYPREAWAKVGAFDVELPAWEDWDFAIKVVEAGYCGTRVAVPLFHYRIHSGARREAGFADREALKQEIFNRWSHYISGESQMPCGCTGGGGLPSLPSFDVYQQSMAANVPVEAKSEGATLLEYIGDAAAPITYSGQTTGTRYRFSSDDDHKVRWVYNSDVAHLLRFSEFRVYANAEALPALVAAGPPR
jgi:glycosyltransferase involved in cell wall biosynthesis